MPEGHYGTVDIKGVMYKVTYWASLKSDCQKRSKVYRQAGYNSRVIKHPIKLGSLAGSGTFDQWAVAIRKRKERK